MARRAHSGSARKSGCDVIGNRAANGSRAVPRGRVTAHAIGGAESVIVVDMARRAGSGSR